jgi:hypothetical protein
MDVNIAVSDLPDPTTVVVDRRDWLCVPMSTTVEDVQQLLAGLCPEFDGTNSSSSDTGDGSQRLRQFISESDRKPTTCVIAVVDEDGHVISVAQGEDVWSNGL